MPAFALKLLADFEPHYLTIHGFIPAIWAGLIMMLIGVLTKGQPRAKNETANNI